MKFHHENVVKPFYTNGRQTIYLGDCRELMNQAAFFAAESASATVYDMILTDPPYLPEFSWCWRKLGKWGQTYLKENGSLFTLLGVINLPLAIKGLRRLTYWWTGGMFHNVPFPYRQSVQCRWKPALWYVNGEKPMLTNRWPCDLMPALREKTLHPWQQPISWLEYWMSHLTKENEIILDPFMGAGTVLLAAKRLNRRCVGIEIEEKTAEKAARRLEKDLSLGIVIESSSPLPIEQGWGDMGVSGKKPKTKKKPKG